MICGGGRNFIQFLNMPATMFRLLQHVTPCISDKNISNNSPEMQSELNDISQIRKEFKEFPGGSIDLLLNEESGIAQLCLNHPEKRNAISGNMMVGLEVAIDQLEKWNKGKGVIIYGAEHNFCSGGDLSFAQKTGTFEGGYKMATFMQHVLGRLQNLLLITVAFIEGTGALGGGAEIATACDFRLMSSNPTTGIGFVHAKMGIIPAWGGNYMLQKLVGYHTALNLVTTAKIVRADEGKQIGLVSDIAETFDEAVDWLKERTQFDSTVLHAAKLVAIKVRQRDADILAEEKKIFSPFWGGSLNKKALSKRIKHRL